MKSLQKIKIMVLLFSVITVDLLALSAPTNFMADTVTNSTIHFTWVDKSNDEDGYVVCVKLKIGDLVDCSKELTPNTTSYTRTDISEYTSKKYVVIAHEGTAIAESNSIIVKTTHTWDGELQKCINEDLGHGADNTTHTPTKSELEGFTRDFYCKSKELESMNPVVDLKNITKLNLYDNNITGTIPTWIGQLTALTSLSLDGNQLTGNIPVELGELTALTSLSLSGNQLTGTIPTWIGQLTDLTSLSLGGNQLTGTIPTWIGQLTALTSLYLDFNQLTGTIPTEIGQLTDLTSLSLGGNQLTGTIPTWIGQLTDLTSLSLTNNQLTGNIPTEIGQLTALASLRLSVNQLTGIIPTWIGQLMALEYLYLYDNNLNGEIPTSIENLTAMKSDQLRIHNNCNLYSEYVFVQSYIDTYQPEDTSTSGYQRILDTNSHDCFNASTLVPVIMYLLN